MIHSWLAPFSLSLTETFCRFVDLKHNTSLHSITFDQLIICEPYPGRHSIARYVPRIMATIKSPVKQLILRVQINTVDDLNMIDWDAMILVIRTNDNWGGLERVIVAGPRKEILDESEQWMKTRLGALGHVNVMCTLLPKVAVSFCVELSYLVLMGCRLWARKWILFDFKYEIPE